MKRDDRFFQPASACHIVSRSGSGTILNNEALDAGRTRVAAGEDPEKVAHELAMMELELRADVFGPDDSADFFGPDDPE